jgi:membrane protein
VKIIDRAKGALRAGRRRFHWLDHLMRANDRNTEVYGSRLAGAITYFAFLSLFPIIAVAFAILGYVVDVYPDAREQVSAVIEENLPGLVGTGSGQLNIDSIANAKSTASVLGLLGLLYSGTGWIDATREALGQVFGLPRDTRNIVMTKLVDVGVLALLGSAILLTVAISSVTTAATNLILGLVGLEGSTVAEWLLRALTLLLAIALNTAIFAVLLARLGGTDTPGKRPAWKRIRGGALLGGVGFEILKLLATYLIGNTLDNPVYGAFAVIVGLLVWMNFVARLLVFAAAWTATEPYSLIPGEGPGGGAGRVTPLSADTEPVLAVAPPPPPGELVPEGPVSAQDQPAAQPVGAAKAAAKGAAKPAEIYAERRRSFAVGAAIGGAAGALLARARSNGRSGGTG